MSDTLAQPAHVRITPVWAGDSYGLASLRAATWPDIYANKAAGITPEFCKEMAAAFTTDQRLADEEKRIAHAAQEPSHFRRAARHGAQIVGQIEGHSMRSGFQGILQLAVLEQYRGVLQAGGITVGQMLLNSFIEWCDPRREIDVVVPEYNDRALRFYERNGFEPEPGLRPRQMLIIPCLGLVRKPQLKGEKT